MSTHQISTGAPRVADTDGLITAPAPGGLRLLEGEDGDADHPGR